MDNLHWIIAVLGGITLIGVFVRMQGGFGHLICAQSASYLLAQLLRYLHSKMQGLSLQQWVFSGPLLAICLVSKTKSESGHA